MPSILVVCSGNLCRSPIAEGLLRSSLLERFGQEAPDVSSAGTIARDGAHGRARLRHEGATMGIDAPNVVRL